MGISLRAFCPLCEGKHVKLKRFAAGLSMAAATATVSILATASPASAAPCGSPGCGGIVQNTGSSGPGVYVANCWSGASTYSGESPPCTNGRVSLNQANAMYFVSPGQTTRNWRYYYDVDAYKVGANCVLNMDGVVTDRRGRGPIWYKITDAARKNIQSYRCF
jgi:hypothetical protein